MLQISRSLSVVTLTWVVTLIVPAAVCAHSSWTLVRDPVRGVVYYSDLYQVWQIDRAGQRTVALPNVHTHELRLDAAGNLYGDERETIGGYRESTVWKHRVWRLTPERRRREAVTPWSEGPWVDDYGFVADAKGALYWGSCPDPNGPCVVKRRIGETISVAAGGAEFKGPLEFLAEDGRGGILVVDGPDIKRITPSDALELVAEDVPEGSGRLSLMGMYAAPDGSLYAAAFDDQTILRLTEEGVKTVVARSPDPWRPSAVLVSPEGLWVLERDPNGQTQLRLLRPDGQVQVWGPTI